MAIGVGIGVPFKHSGGGGVVANPDFVATWSVASDGDTITLPLLSGGTYSGTIDWGDSSTSSLSYANQTHTFTTAGTYTITLSGTIEGFSFNNSGDKLKIHDVSNWGTLVITNGQSVFQNCSNLTVSATDTPTLNTTTLKWFMYNCDALTTEDFSACDTSNVTIMESTFPNSLLFNANLSGWGHSGVTTYRSMISACPAFNNNSLNTWDVSGATTMYEFAKGCTAFNGSVSGWEFTTSCTLYAAFQNCSAFTGTGFTTREAELIALHKDRRKIASVLMILGSAGFVTLIATLVTTITNPSTPAQPLFAIFSGHFPIQVPGRFLQKNDCPLNRMI